MCRCLFAWFITLIIYIVVIYVIESLVFNLTCSHSAVHQNSACSSQYCLMIVWHFKMKNMLVGIDWTNTHLSHKFIFIGRATGKHFIIFHFLLYLWKIWILRSIKNLTLIHDDLRYSWDPLLCCLSDIYVWWLLHKILAFSPSKCIVVMITNNLLRSLDKGIIVWRLEY